MLFSFVCKSAELCLGLLRWATFFMIWINPGFVQVDYHAVWIFQLQYTSLYKILYWYLQQIQSCQLNKGFSQDVFHIISTTKFPNVNRCNIWGKRLKNLLLSIFEQNVSISEWWFMKPINASEQQGSINEWRLKRQNLKWVVISEKKMTSICP